MRMDGRKERTDRIDGRSNGGFMFRRKEKGRVNGCIDGMRHMWKEGWMVRRRNYKEDGWNGGEH